MKPLLPLAVLLAVAIAGCSKSDPNAKYRDAQLKRGIKIADIKEQFGEPDMYDDWWNKDPDNVKSTNYDYDESYSEWSLQQSPENPHHVEELNYGAFGTHSPKKGHITKHRLSVTFVDGELYTWEKSTPSNRE